MSKMDLAKVSLIALAVTLLPLNLNAKEADNSDWQLEKSADDIHVFSQIEPNSSFKRIKATTTVSTNLKSLVSFLQDVSTNPQWVPHSGGATLVERISDKESIVHFITKGSWPFKDRDAVARFIIDQDHESLAIKIIMEATPTDIPLPSNTVRMAAYQGDWKLTPKNSSQTHIEYVSYIEPGGSIPAWLANPFAVKTTWQAMKNLQSQAFEYNQVLPHLHFIKNYPEPNHE